MNTVYVVNQSWQDYGGGGGTPILVTPTLAVAEAKVEEMKARMAAREETKDSIRAHMTTWEMNNPRGTTGEQFSTWVSIRYDELKRFGETFQEHLKVDLHELNDDLFWEIETVPYEE